MPSTSERDASTDLERRQLTPLVMLLTANAISRIGNILTYVAVPWFVLQTTGSPARAGVVGAAAAIPLILAGVLGGALIDRLGYRRMSVISDLASGVTVAMVPLLHLSVGLAFWQLVGLVFLSALLDAPGSTARRSLLPELADLAQLPLERANAALESINRLAVLLRPPFAGILIVALGASTVLLVDAVTFFASAIIIVAMVPVMRTAEPSSGTGYVHEIFDGLRFIYGDRVVLLLVVVFALSNFIDAPMGAVILPVYADEVFGSPIQLGVMLAGFGFGALLGAILFGVVGARLPRRTTIVISLLVSATLFGLLSRTPSLELSVALLVLDGIAFGPINPLFNTILQERIPSNMRGRILGMVTSIMMVATPIGVMLGGILIETTGLSTTLLLQALGYMTVAIVVIVMRPFRILRP